MVITNYRQFNKNVVYYNIIFNFILHFFAIFLSSYVLPISSMILVDRRMQHIITIIVTKAKILTKDVELTMFTIMS